MALSDSPSVRITPNTSQEISDKLLGAAIEFCRKTGYQEDLAMLSFFWTAFLHLSKDELGKYGLTDFVIECCPVSFSHIFPEINTNKNQAARAREFLSTARSLLAPFKRIETSDEISSFLQSADQFEKQNAPDAALTSKRNPQLTFPRYAQSVPLVVHQTLCQTESDVSIQYKNNLIQYRQEKNRAAEPPKTTATPPPHLNPTPTSVSSPSLQNSVPRPSAPAPKISPATSTAASGALGMKWYKFLIYFGLIFGPISTIFSGLATMIQGLDWEDPLLSLYGVFLIAISVYGFVVRHKLARYKVGAPRAYLKYYSFNTFAPYVYTVYLALVIGVSVNGSIVLSFIISLLLWRANRSYFRKRAHLFNGYRPIVKPVTGNPSPLSFSAPRFCKACGALVPAGANFCLQCGTKIE